MTIDPLIHGAALPAGVHVDLVGGFRPHMREADNDVIRRASDIFVDTREGVLAEAGDIMRPIAEGVLKEADIAADLAELCRGKHAGRTNAQAITVFKSVGAASEDLAAAITVYESAAK
jgi:ornithine cyclodeaminase